MKRLALVVAAVVLGTGCIFVDDGDCDRSVTVDWSFRNYLDQVTSSCGTAGVDELDIYVNDRYVATFSCSGPPATISRITRGATLVRVDAIDLSAGGSGRIAYRDEFSVDVSTCGDHDVASQPTEALLDLNYAATCPSGPCYLWFSLFDELAGSVATRVDGASAPTSYLFPADVTFRVPAGRFTLDWMQLVTPTGVPATPYGHVAALCAPLTFDVQGGTTTIPGGAGTLDLVSGCFPAL